ncbi:hypothetical protein D9M71_756160 [compost metagenome]
MLTPRFERVQGELLDLGAANSGMQVVMQAGASGLVEKTSRDLLKLRSTQCLEATGLLVAAIEQAVDILFDKALALADRRRVAKQEKHPRPGFDLALGHALQQPVEQLDRRCLITMNAGRQKQV